MIDTPLHYIALLLLIASTLVYLEQRSNHKLFNYLPAIVMLYFVVMLFSTLGVWQKSEAITQSYKTLKNTLLPAMIFLMLLQANLRHIMMLGAKMVWTFLLASISIAIGFIGMFALFSSYFGVDAWKTFAALSGSWMGGTSNMVAIQNALHLPESAMGYTLLIDSIDYAIWVMILLALVPFAKHFNRWSRANTTAIDTIGAMIEKRNATKREIDFVSIYLLLSISLVISALTEIMATSLPTSAFMTPNTWQVILATLLGILFAHTPLAKLSGANEVANIMLYFIIALIASRANFYELTEAPLYIVAGFTIIVIHALLMILFAKLFKLDLFSIGVASLANIGGIASAPILASAYSKALIPIGVLMAMLGYIIGTFGGLLVGKVLQGMA
jgi:uncharacterized membrane protein